MRGLLSLVLLVDPLREELCPIDIVEQDTAHGSVVALRSDDIQDPGDAWLAWVRPDRNRRLHGADAASLLHGECVLLRRATE